MSGFDVDADELLDVFSSTGARKRTSSQISSSVGASSSSAGVGGSGSEVTGGRQGEAAEESSPSLKAQKGSAGQRVESDEAIPEELRSIFADRSRCLHEICVPAGYTGPDPFADEPSGKPPAKEYPFQLDAFQAESVRALEKHHSVLVSAHTSAGKTAVAEYAIAMALRDSERVVYTSPIKALSNQKFRELTEEFQDVGLMTGDVTINPNASCLVMTTEILRSMLYRGSEILREVAWVIFDEVHYMRDKERGVVWEETIILLPDKVRMVFLSATIPNAKEFADWVADLHKQPVHVVYTEFRPTPLQHFIFPAGGEGVYLIVDEKGKFREDNFQKALASLQNADQDAALAAKGGNKKQAAKGQQSDVKRIIKMILERHLDPVIVFSFSKRECEALAMQLSKVDFNDEDEKALIARVFNNAIEPLAEEDKTLPQVVNILPLLKRGIGIHHGGLLPILKEVIEILFQEGLLKVLFSTETFSMGLNMPAKTVVFTNLRKFDGTDFRWISGGEYVQMSGRAGRRGLDDRGIVIMMVDDKLDIPTAKNMLNGRSDPLISQFHLSYNMLLNLLRIETVDPEYIMSRSFHQFQAQRARPDMLKALEDIDEELVGIQVEGEEEVAEYYRLRSEIERNRVIIQNTICKPVHCLPYLQPGRLVHVKDQDLDWGWGVVVNFQKQASSKGRPSGPDAQYIVDLLLFSRMDDEGLPKPVPSDELASADMEVIPMSLELLYNLSSIRIHIPKDLRTTERRRQVAANVREVFRRFPDGVPLLDPIQDMQIDDKSFTKAIRKVEMLEGKLRSNPRFQDSPTLDERFKTYCRKLDLGSKKRELQKSLRSTEEVVMKEDLKCMKRVLRRLEFTNSENIIQTKGRVACEINTADELLLTELMFNGAFNQLSPEQVVALLSCLVASEKSDEDNRLREELAVPYRELVDTGRRVAKISQECKINIDVEEYVESFRPNLMELVFAWCKGAKFADICKMTTIFEGTIIRAIRRLEELLRQLAAASRAIGDDTLESKFDAGIALIKRDIVFAASLYL